MKNLQIMIIALTLCNLIPVHAMENEKYASVDTYKKNLEKDYPQDENKQIDVVIADFVSKTMAQEINHVKSLQETLATIPSQYRSEYQSRCINQRRIIENKFHDDNEAILTYSISRAISAHTALQTSAKNN